MVFGWRSLCWWSRWKFPQLLRSHWSDAQLSPRAGLPDTEEELQRYTQDSTTNWSSVLTTMIVGVVYPIIAENIIVPRPYRHISIAKVSAKTATMDYRDSAAAQTRAKNVSVLILHILCFLFDLPLASLRYSNY